MARQTDGPRFRPAQWARQEDVSELEEAVGALDEHVRDLAEVMDDTLVDIQRALLAQSTAIFELQQAVFDTERDGPEPDGEPEEFVNDDVEEDFDALPPEPEDEAPQRRDAAGEEAYAPGADDPDAVWAAQEAARLRAEAANEGSLAEQEALAQRSDPNAILDVPEEGVTISPAKPEPDLRND